MKRKITNLLFCLALVAALPAFAHGPMTARHGGVVQMVNDRQYELTHQGGMVTLYVEDHEAKVATSGMSGKLTVLNGSDKTETPLLAGQGNDLVAKDPVTVKSGTKIVASIKDGKGVALVRFTIK